MKFPRVPKKHLKNLSKSAFWFLTGAVIALILLTGFSVSIFQTINKNVVYPGVFVNNVNFGGKTQQEVQSYFDVKNEKIGATTFSFISDADISTTSAKDLDFGYNSKLLSIQAYSIGRSKDVFSNASLIA